jgi:NitT/TauT family transport system substrate-binding protein
MKKKIIITLTGLFILIVALILIITTGKKDTKDSDLTTIKVAEVTHSAFYTPFYVAIEKGFFKDNGIEIDLILTSGANNVVAAVLSGDVDVGLCGPEATIYVYNEGEKDYVKTFAGLTKRDGQFIVSRTKIDNFKLTDLTNKEVLAGRAGGMPILNFYTALKNENIKTVNINDSVDFANLTSAFISGSGDFVNLFEPNATKLENLGYGYVVASVGSYSLEVPYTAFNAKLSYIENNEDLIKKFRDSINMGLEYTLNTDSEIIAEDIINLFPDTSINDLITIIERYKLADTWLEDTYISEDLFNNLLDMLIDGDLIDNYVPYNDLIAND